MNNMKQNNNNIFERNMRKTMVIIVLIVFFVIDITVSNVYKLLFGYSFHDKRQYIEKNIEETYRISSDIYHHDLAKNIYLENSIWGGKNYTVATDSLGFKVEKPKNTPMISDKYRIAFIGDSFTEGIGVRYQDTFVGKIANHLLENNIEVLNAAVASYSPIIYYKKINYLLGKGLKFNELVVFIDISDVQDEALYYQMSDDNNVVSKNKKEDTLKNESISNKIKKTIKNNFILTYFALNQVDNFIFDSDVKKQQPMSAINLVRSMWTVDEKIFKAYGNEGLKKAEFYMDKLYNLLKNNNISLTIAVYPWPDQIYNNDLNSIQVKHWRKWAQKNKIGFLNYFPCFISQSLKSKTNNFDKSKQYFINGDVHWNEKGHKLISNEFLAFYNNNNGKCVELGH